MGTKKQHDGTTKRLWLDPNLLFITVIGAIIRLPWMIVRPISCDEAHTITTYGMGGFVHTLRFYDLPNNHILHSLFVNLTRRFLGTEVWAMRLPAFAAGVLLIVATYLLAFRVIKSKAAALLAAGAVAVLPPLVFYSTNARGYTLQILLAVVSVYAGVMVLDRVKYWTIAAGVFIAASAAAIWTLPSHLIALAGIGVWLVSEETLRQKTWKDRLVGIGLWAAIGVSSIVGALILYAPVAISHPSGLGAVFNNQFTQPVTRAEWIDSLTWAFPMWMEFSEGGLPTWVTMVTRALVVIGFIAGLVTWTRFIKASEDDSSPSPVFLSGFVVVGFVGIAALWFRSVLPPPRTILYLLPFYWIAVAAGIVSIGRLLLRATEVPKAALLATSWIGIAVMGAITLYPKGMEGWEEGANFRSGEDISRYLAESHPDAYYVSTSPVTEVLLYFAIHDELYSRDQVLNIWAPAKPELSASDSIVLIAKSGKDQEHQMTLLLEYLELDDEKRSDNYAEVENIGDGIVYRFQYGDWPPSPSTLSN